MTTTTMEYDPRNIHVSGEELVQSGHLACPGCGSVIGMRIALKALGKTRSSLSRPVAGAS